MKLTFHGVVYSKKNSKRIVRNKYTGKMALVSNNRALANEKDMVTQFYAQPVRIVPNSPVSVQIRIWEKDRTKRDLDNQATAILDALVKAGIIPDDSISIVQKLSVELAGFDKEDPRAEVAIAYIEPTTPGA